MNAVGVSDAVTTITTWFRKLHFHKTPYAVVKLLKKHVPSSAKKILDPAVGEGALLDALYSSQLNESLTLVDIDAKRLEAIRAVYNNLSLINADFVSWSKDRPDDSFDLIITNPPFSARAEKWINHEGRKWPIELIFFKKCVDLLQKGGTLLAIVPDTLVNSTRLQKDREWFVSRGAFIYAYQLPARSFSNIEGAFYLFVFKKGIKQKDLTLRSTDGNPEVKITNQDFIRNGYRLDHSFYQGNFQFERLLTSSTLPLSTFYKISRGPIRQDYKKFGYNHSDSFEGGGWRSYHKSSHELLCVGVKRVSRNAHLSFGLYPTSAIPTSTDCIVFIQPLPELALKVLFYLRVLLANDDGKSILLKGAGAKFIQVETLKQLPHFDLSKIYPAEFISYKSSYERFDYQTCESIERSVYTSMTWGKKVSVLNGVRSDVLASESLSPLFAAIS